MSTEADPLSKLPANLRAALRQYADFLRQTAGAKALSLSLLGAAAAGTWIPGRHRVHNALVLESIKLDDLERLARELPRYHQVGIASPLVLTPDYIRRSIDTFPLEFLEIQQQHLALFGEDRFQPLEFEAKFVRLQCERELKSMILAMRQALLASAGDPRHLVREHPHAADGLLRVVRGMLWLNNLREALPAAQAISELERVLARPLPGLKKMVEAHGPTAWADYRALDAELLALERVADAS